MASMKTRQGMVILKEGATAPAAAPAADHSPAGLVTLRTGKFQNGTAVQGISVSIGEKKITKKVKMLPAKEAVVKMGELKHPSSLNLPSGLIPPDCICKGVKVTLDNNSMWNEFFKCRTEMILTKQGSRMFPYLRFHISGLQPSRKYSLMMDIEPLENSQYKWTGESWQVCKKAECYVKSKPFVHPDSPATGQHWMQSPVSFYKLKLTNDVSEQEGNIFLRPMQRYLPQLHLVPADRAGEDLRLNAPNVLTFTFPQTEFMTVTSYQNPQFTQLKVNYNPFVKKLKEDKVNSCSLKPTGTSSKDLNSNEGKANSDLHPMKKNLKVLLANHKLRQKAPDSKVSAPKEPQEESVRSNAQPAAGAPEECPGSSRPAPKLISELICEAHVSLQRCRVEQSGGGSFSRGAAPGNTTSTTMTDRNRSVVHKNNGSVTTSLRKSAAAERAGKVKSDERLSSSCDWTAAAPPLEPLPSNKPDHQRDVGASSDAEKQQKRPTRLPLPALALFLKQHSAKSKKAKNKADSVPRTSVLESSAMSQQKDIMEVSREDILQEERGLDGPGGTLPQPSSPDMLPGSDPLVSPSESLSLGPPDPNEGPMMSNPEKSCGPVQASAPAVSACSTSASSHLSLPLSTTLSLPDSPRAAGEPSTPPSSSRSVKLDSVLPDPQCSSFDFDPLSPASSPESLPPLPASLALELDSSSSAEEEPSSRNSSVFKWHTVLPLSEAYTRSPFPALEPPQQSTPLMSVSPPLFSCLPESQSQTPSPSNPPKEPLPSFSEGEQSLPFPAELSPLALQLSLSPTFSSLDEDGLSPTTSLSDLVHFFSTDDDMGVEFSHPEAVAAPIQAPPASEPPQPSAPVQAASCSRSCKRKKSSRTTQLDRLEVGEDEDDYRSKQPKVEEVEEQLFISFTSKEALKLHTAESSEEQLPNPLPVPEPPPAEEPELRSTGSLKDRIAVCEETILRDLKLMKYRQVIHPVLQEVGLKMTLLDPALSIDLQYLGVCLPIPPPGAMEPQTQTEPTPQGIFASFQSRTGKTTDMTQIKGWKEKFPPPEAESLAAPKLEAAGPSSDVQKKNLSAFCSDMLDEYLESEGKLIDERASTFSQLPVEAPPFQLQLSGASYVRTLDHVLKKATAGTPASDIISGFIPPSKRSRLKKIPNCRKTARKRRRPRWTRFRASPATPQRPAAGPVQDSVQTPGGPAQPTEPQNPPTPKKRRLKPRTSSRTLGAPGSTHVSEDMAPLESDSELRTDSGPNQLSDRTGEPGGKEKRASGTRALARLKELEDGVAWEGCFQTSITEERATIALMSLFTQTVSSSFTADRIRTILPLARKGFVREDPTAPIRLKQRPALQCLNEFCRLGCVCLSLSHCFRASHCGRPACMLGCSCLKQKVVILRNMDSSASESASSPSKTKKKKKSKRVIMKMAYVLKEADTAASPAEQIRTLWRRNAHGPDSEPVHMPDVAPLLRPVVRRKRPSSCARVRGFLGRKQKEGSRKLTLTRHEAPKLPRHGQRSSTDVDPPRPCSDADPAPGSDPPSPSEERHPKPSKRLLIVADCKWGGDSERSYVLKKLCEAMALDHLDRPFWIRKYLITPVDQTVDDSSGNRCIQYRVQISTPLVKEQAPPTGNPGSHGGEQAVRAAAEHGQEGSDGSTGSDPDKKSGFPLKNEEPPADRNTNQTLSETVEDWQREVTGEEEIPMEEEEGPMEDWQEEITEEELLEDAGDCRRSPIREELRTEGTAELNQVKEVESAVPLLTRVPPNGFLSAKKKQPGGSDEVIQVNGKPYPFAKIQLGRMGALHPANRLAAYLTGRVRSQTQRQPSSLSCRPQSTPSVTCSAVCAPPAPTARIQTQPTASSPSADSEPKQLVVGSSASSLNPAPPKDPQPLLVPGPPNVLHLVPPPPTCIQLQGPKKGASEPIQPSSGIRYYRRPDGSLVQLIPINQLRPVNPASTIQGDSEPKQLVVGPSAPSLNPAPPKDPRPLLVPGPPNVLHLLAPPPPCIRLPGPKVVPEPAQPSSGIRYYRMPDGSLVQLIPINRSTIQGVRPASCLQLPPGSILNRPPLTALSSSSSSSSSVLLPSPSFEPSSSSVSPQPAPSVSWSQQSSFPTKVVPANRLQDPIILQLPFLPPTKPVAPEGGLLQTQGQTPRVVPVQSPVYQQADMVDRSDMVAEDMTVQKQGVSDQLSIHTPAECARTRGDPHPPPPRPMPDGYSSEQDCVSDPEDLDIVCVEQMEVVDLLSSSETENSSDFGDSEAEDERGPAADKQCMKLVQQPGSVDADLNKEKNSLQKSEQEDQPIPGPSEDGIFMIPTSYGRILCGLTREQLGDVKADQAATARKEGKDGIYVSSEDGLSRITAVDDAAAAFEFPDVGQQRKSPQKDQERKSSSSREDLELEDSSPVVNSTKPQTRFLRTTHDKGLHNLRERISRAQIRQMFLNLKKQVHPSSYRMSKASILKKAQEVIQQLNRDEENLKRKKERMLKKRDKYLSLLVPSEADQTGGAAVKEEMDLIYISSEEDSLNRRTVADDAAAAVELSDVDQRRSSPQQDQKKTSSSSGEDLELEDGSPVVNPGRTALLGQVPQEVQKLPSEAESLRFSQSVSKQEDGGIQDVCSKSETDEEKQQTISRVPAEAARRVAPSETRWPPPCQGSGQPIFVRLQPTVPLSDPAPPLPGFSEVKKRTRTIPNILSRSRHQAASLKAEELKSDSVPVAVHPESTQHRRPEQRPPLSAAAATVLLLPTECGRATVQNPGAAGPLGPNTSQSSAPNTDGPSAGPKPRSDSDNQSLSSLLSEIVFLNQQTVTTVTPADQGSPQVYPGGSEERRRAAPRPEAPCEGVLTPPPLLHMKVGAAKAEGLSTNDGSSVGGGVAWRPMPRLVPLGLRGNSPS